MTVIYVKHYFAEYALTLINGRITCLMLWYRLILHKCQLARPKTQSGKEN